MNTDIGERPGSELQLGTVITNAGRERERAMRRRKSPRARAPRTIIFPVCALGAAVENVCMSLPHVCGLLQFYVRIKRRKP